MYPLHYAERKAWFTIEFFYLCTESYVFRDHNRRLAREIFERPSRVRTGFPLCVVHAQLCRNLMAKFDCESGITIQRQRYVASTSDEKSGFSKEGP